MRVRFEIEFSMERPDDAGSVDHAVADVVCALAKSMNETSGTDFTAPEGVTTTWWAD